MCSKLIIKCIHTPTVCTAQELTVFPQALALPSEVISGAAGQSSAHVLQVSLGAVTAKDENTALSYLGLYG